jgi:hypothetical protein
MDSLTNFIVSIAVSLLVSTTVLLAIMRPLRNAMATLCKSDEALSFWHSFTVIMLYAAPLFFSVLWTPFEADLVRIVRTALVGSLFGTMSGLAIIGIKVAGARKA